MAQFEISMKNQRGLTVLTDYDIMSNRTAGLTFDERLNLNVDGSTLDFSMLKYLYEGSQKVVSTAAMSITYGTVIQLIVNNYRYDFAVTDIDYQFMSENIELAFSSQDLFQFEVSRLGIGYTVEGDTTDPQYLGAQPIDYWARKIIQENNLNWAYIPIDELNYDILVNYNSGATNQARNNINNDIENWLELPKTDYSTLNTPVSFECSGSNAYNALKQLANDNELFIWVDYSARNFGFVPLKNPIFNGYYFNPNNNLQAFSLRGSGSNLVTVLNVTGPKDVNNQEITLMPTLPLSVVNYINSDAWDSSIYYHDFYDTIAPNDEEFVNQINYTPWLENKLINTDFFVDSNILLSSEQHDIQNTLLNPLRIANGHMIVAWTSYLTKYEKDLMDVNQNEIQLEALYSSLYGDLSQFYTLLENDELINIAYLNNGHKYVSIHTPTEVYLDITIGEDIYNDVTHNAYSDDNIQSLHTNTVTGTLATSINAPIERIQYEPPSPHSMVGKYCTFQAELIEDATTNHLLLPVKPFYFNDTSYWAYCVGGESSYSNTIELAALAQVTLFPISEFYLGFQIKSDNTQYSFSPENIWLDWDGWKANPTSLMSSRYFPSSSSSIPITCQRQIGSEISVEWTDTFNITVQWGMSGQTVKHSVIITCTNSNHNLPIRTVFILPITKQSIQIDNRNATVIWNTDSISIVNNNSASLFQVQDTAILPQCQLDLSTSYFFNPSDEMAQINSLRWMRNNAVLVDTVLKHGPAILQPYTVTYEYDEQQGTYIAVPHNKPTIKIDENLDQNVLQSIYAVQNWQPTFKNDNLAGLAEFMNTSGSKYDSMYQIMLENLYLFRQEWNRTLLTYDRHTYTLGRLYSTYYKIGAISDNTPVLEEGQAWSVQYLQYTVSEDDVSLLEALLELRSGQSLLRDSVIQYFASVAAKLTQYWNAAYNAAQTLGIFLPETWDCINILEEQSSNLQLSQIMLPLYVADASNYKAPYWNVAPLINNTLIPLVDELTHYPLQYHFHDDNATPLPTILDNNHTQLYYQPVNSVDDYHPSYNVLYAAHSSVADDNIHLYSTKQRVKCKEYTNSDDTPLLSVEQVLQRYVVDDLGLNQTLVAKWLQFLATHMQYNLSKYYQALDQHNNIWQQLHNQYPGIFRESEYVDQSAMNSNELYLAAKRELDKLSKPEFSYNLTGMDIYMHQSDFSPTRIKLGEQIRIDYQEEDNITDTLNAALREPLFITGISHTLRNDGEYQFTVTTRTATDNMVQRFAKLLNFGR